jgi:undecaprenyl diphosphate synthase
MTEPSKVLARSNGLRACPRHVAIIMDGNGRWAEARGLPRVSGHAIGVEAVRRAVRAATELKIEVLTIFSFSTENWRRPADEVEILMGLMKRFIRSDLAELHASGVKIKVIGEREGVEQELLDLVDDAVKLTASNTALTLVIAFNYGARDEIAKAARRLAEHVAAGTLSAGEITAASLSQCLDTSSIPDPDLVIRTSGEQRLSNFLLWQAAYAEFVFLDVHWPDFAREHFEAALDIYRSRDRRFGGLSARSAS